MRSFLHIKKTQLRQQLHRGACGTKTEGFKSPSH